MKSLQWEQNVGCLKNRGRNLWSWTVNTFFFLSAPFRALTIPLPHLTISLAEVDSVSELTDPEQFTSPFSSAISCLIRTISIWFSKFDSLFYSQIMNEMTIICGTSEFSRYYIRFRTKFSVQLLIQLIVSFSLFLFWAQTQWFWFERRQLL